ncbi:GH25 family lysozyme [Convivina praedatoris]|uniref:GH25 family lysozyme n=1 Tax=Convivina praedatoris TaxID=2880963 RepID=UPI002F40CB57
MEVNNMFVADVSDNNPADISGIISENDAVIVKVTEGNSYVNKHVTTQVNQVKESGKKLGLYHFIVGGIDAKEQAQFFLDNAAPECYDPDVPLLLDFENMAGYPVLSGYEPREIADYIYEKTGKKVWLYIGYSDVVNSVHGYSWEDMADNPVWIADYPYMAPTEYTQELQDWADNTHFVNIKEWKIITMWQYVCVPYDRSIFYGDARTWDLLAAPVNNQTDQHPESESPQPDSQSDTAQQAIGVIDEQTKSEIHDLAQAIADKTK